MSHHIFHVLPMKDLVNQYGSPTTPQNMATGTKRLVSNVCVLFCPCVAQKET